jgi:transketolase
MVRNEADIAFLEDKARQLRRDVITMVYRRKSGHIGGSLSIAEMMAVLYYHEMRIDPSNPRWAERDRFVLSKGHNAPILYAALADKGFFDKGLLYTSFRTTGGLLQGHPDMKATPGVDMSTGSLGIGLSAACGMALGAKMGNHSFKVYVVIGDGEMNEGQIWEAAVMAAHFKLDNLVVLADLNGMQNDGYTKDIMAMDPVADKWSAFGWNTAEIDGHNVQEMVETLDRANDTTGKPTVILCHTVKGKGVSFMENSVSFHGSSPNAVQYKQAMKELAN